MQSRFIKDFTKSLVRRVPILEPLAARVAQHPSVSRLLGEENFDNSGAYWERRYAKGGNSGAGSYGRLAQFKAEILNELVLRQNITSVIEFGCGDGAQLELARYPSYLGVDVSLQAIDLCRARFQHDPAKHFVPANWSDLLRIDHDLALSLDVIYHLVEDGVFDRYMRTLFDAASRYVVIYASDYEAGADAAHVRHRAFSHWVLRERPDWIRLDFIPNRYPFDSTRPHDTSFADFHLFGRVGDRGYRPLGSDFGSLPSQ